MGANTVTGCAAMRSASNALPGMTSTRRASAAAVVEQGEVLARRSKYGAGKQATQRSIGLRGARGGREQRGQHAIQVARARRRTACGRRARGRSRAGCRRAFRYRRSPRRRGCARLRRAARASTSPGRGGDARARAARATLRTRSATRARCTSSAVTQRRTNRRNPARARCARDRRRSAGSTCVCASRSICRRFSSRRRKR